MVVRNGMFVVGGGVWECGESENSRINSRLLKEVSYGKI